MGRNLAIAAAVVIGLIFIKDGTFGSLVGDAARGLSDAGKGLKPLTNIA